MLPVIREFMSAHRLPDVTVVADAGMISEANQKAIQAAGLSFILGMRIPDVPYVIAQWHREHSGEQIPDGHIFVQPWPAGPTVKLPGPGHLLPVPAWPGPPHPARDRRLGRQGRARRRREGPGQAQLVHPAVRRRHERQPGPGGQGSS